MKTGLIVIAAFITPYHADQDAIRQAIPTGQLVMGYVDCPLDVCMARDPKGLYKKAQSGDIARFTGISDPYEPPLAPDVHLLTATISVRDALLTLHQHLLARGLLSETTTVSEGVT